MYNGVRRCSGFVDVLIGLCGGRRWLISRRGMVLSYGEYGRLRLRRSRMCVCRFLRAARKESFIAADNEFLKIY